jgi:hypothetical protein
MTKDESQKRTSRGWINRRAVEIAIDDCNVSKYIGSKALWYHAIGIDMERLKKKLSDEAFEEFWANHKQPPSKLASELAEDLISALKHGVAKQQREDQESAQKTPKPPRP